MMSYQQEIGMDVTRTPKPLLPVQRTGLRDHGSVEDFRARQIERMRRAGWAPKEKRCG